MLRHVRVCAYVVRVSGPPRRLHTHAVIPTKPDKRSSPAVVYAPLSSAKLPLMIGGCESKRHMTSIADTAEGLPAWLRQAPRHMLWTNADA